MTNKITETEKEKKEKCQPVTKEIENERKEEKEEKKMVWERILSLEERILIP